jgi:hypothetical protein
MAAARIVYFPEGAFGVLDAEEIPVQTAAWSNGLTAPMSRSSHFHRHPHRPGPPVPARARTGSRRRPFAAVRMPRPARSDGAECGRARPLRRFVQAVLSATTLAVPPARHHPHLDREET